MTTKKRKRPAPQSANDKPQTPPPAKKKPSFVSRYIGIDTHLSERGGSTDDVQGIAGERPAGRKLADDIARTCSQLDAEGYDIISIFPLISGRSAEVLVETRYPVSGWTFERKFETKVDSPYGPQTRTETKYYANNGVGYSVTDGAVITAKLRN